MGRQSSLTEVDEQLIVQRYATGWTTDRLAEAFGVSEAAIRRAMDRRGVARRPNAFQRKPSPLPVAELVARRDGGESWSSLSRAAGVSISAVKHRYAMFKRDGASSTTG